MGKLPVLADLSLKSERMTHLVGHVCYTCVIQVRVSILLLLLHLLLLVYIVPFHRPWRKPNLLGLRTLKIFVEWLSLDGIAAQKLQLILKMSNCFILLLQGLGLKNGLSLLLGKIVMTNLCDLM